MDSDNVVGFPPRPRAWRSLIQSVIEGLSVGAVDFSWRPVKITGLDAAWVGVHCVGLEGIGRPWVWDVVTTADHRELAELRGDPLSLAVDQDMVVVVLRKHDDATAMMQLQVPVHCVPEQIEVPRSALPGEGWHLEIATGWSTEAIDGGLARWLRTFVGDDVTVVPWASTAEDEDRFEIGDRLHVSASAFDRLLARDPGEAAMITGCLGAVAEALEPWRQQAA